MSKKILLLLLTLFVVFSPVLAVADELSGRIIYSSKKTKFDDGNIYYEYIIRVKDSHNKFQTLYLRTERDSALQLALKDAQQSTRMVHITYYRRGMKKRIVSILPLGNSSFKEEKKYYPKINVTTSTAVKQKYSTIIGNPGINISTP
ncbi:hypothetical protein [Halodesulfovibrio sp.]|jgi:hypothetical protein|uniref:hypothetical protein n=1 Tax=Halodesulfovibrio sp. TaxID=1912772 RepID=UPI0025EE0E0B|nr:hypothetical protein [Halodesulfovibrio sp.]MCT4535131.1 hypothetical protein [Halodesulfovibrio sp.]